VFVGAVLLEAGGAPVTTVITWGATQVTAVVHLTPLPTWVEAGQVQALVDTTAEWVAQLRSQE